MVMQITLSPLRARPTTAPGGAGRLAQGGRGSEDYDYIYQGDALFMSKLKYMIQEVILEVWVKF
jgi:hypothetical protein